MKLRSSAASVLHLATFLLSVVEARNYTFCPSNVTKPISIPLTDCTSADAYGIQLSYGAGSVCVLPSMQVNNTLLVAAEACGNSTNLMACEGRHGGFFNYATLEGQSLNVLAPEAGNATQNITIAGDATLSVSVSGVKTQTQTQLKDIPVGVATRDGLDNLGQLGLGWNSTFLRTLNETLNLTNGLGYALDVGNQPGELVLGGYNKKKIGDTTNTFPIAPANESACALMINIQSITINYQNSNRNIVIYGQEGTNTTLLPACVEPYYNSSRFPSAIIDAFDASYRNHGAVPTSAPAPNVQYVEPSLVYAGGSAVWISMVITLDNGYQITVGDDDLRMALTGYGYNGNLTNVDLYTSIGISNETLVPGTAVLGRAFLSTLYLRVDYVEGNFNLSDLVTTQDTTMLRPFSTYCMTKEGKKKFQWQVYQIYLLVMGCCVFAGVFFTGCAKCLK